MKLLPNGNVEITIQLMPDAYAALTNTTDRDNLTTVDAINLAIIALDHISTTATAAGTPLGDACAELHPATTMPVVIDGD